MAVHNADIAAVFDEIANLLEIEDANPFRVRAYRNAVRILESLGHEASAMLAEGEDLTKIPGIGKDLAGKIAEIVDTGSCRALKKLQKQLPPGLSDLLHLPGLGPKKVKVLYHDLDVHTLNQLHRAARDGRVHELPGFGAKTEQSILEAIEAHAGEEHRFKLATAAQYARPLVAYLNKISGVDQVELAGSFRRAKETVGDLDILVVAKRSSPVMDRFVAYDEVKKVVSKGPTRSTVILASKLQVDLRKVEAKSFGAALHYFTGSKAHNIAVRRLGQGRGLKINEYGVFKGSKYVAGATEESVFKSVGLPWIPPELRENHGEIEAATAKRLPELVTLADLKGDLHVHTKATDGRHSLREMADAAKNHGLHYIAITEHSRRLTVAHGLDPKHLHAQVDQIDRLNEQLDGITVLKGIEVDILDDGRLDLPDSVLQRLDLVIGAVHSKFNLSRSKQTERILRAMDQRYFTMLAHPSGRLIDRREPYDVDMLKIIRAAKQRGCYLELNAHPERLDLLDVYCQMAKEEGVLISINSDAHRVDDFDNLRYGVGQARRGWLAKDDVLNTRSLRSLRPLLRGTMG